jgi:ribulose-phosphate 3-epimerase
MVEIIPAIIPKSFGDLKEKMSLVSELVPIAQIDVMDGVFVPSKSWPHMRNPDPDFTAILKEENGFPFWETIDFEVDLMVSNPEQVWQNWLLAGAKRIIVHAESSKNLKGLFDVIKKKLPSEDSLLYTEVGVALNIDTPNEQIYPLIPVVDFVQFMGIAKIGFQGEPFDERVLAKIADLRGKYPNATISIDGGVNKENAVALVKAGVNRLVVGSALFGSENISEELMNFQSLII